MLKPEVLSGPREVPPGRQVYCHRGLRLSALPQGRIFIDRSGTLFDEVLSLLRDGPEWMPPEDRCGRRPAAGKGGGAGGGGGGREGGGPVTQAPGHVRCPCTHSFIDAMLEKLQSAPNSVTLVADAYAFHASQWAATAGLGTVTQQ